MPIRRRQKRNVKRRSRKPKMSLKDKVLKIVNKNREMKRLYFTIDEETMSPTGSQFLQFTYPAASGYVGSVVSNKVIRSSGDSYSYSRDGLEITPKYWEWKGIVKYQGTSTSAGYDEVMVRMVLGFVDGDNAPLADGDSELQLTNGTTAGISSDYTAIMRRFNWKKFRPVQERLFKLQPAGFSATVSANASTGFNSNAPVSKMITMKHYFGKNPKNITYPTSGSSQGNSGNLQLLIISRTTNDDTLVTTNSIEVSGEGHFAFYDC